MVSLIFTFVQKNRKKNSNLKNKKVLLTFGFIGRSKGIETVIKALPEVVKKFPETYLYCIREKPIPMCSGIPAKNTGFFFFAW